jgi:hypothetical protein
MFGIRNDRLSKGMSSICDLRGHDRDECGRS